MASNFDGQNRTIVFAREFKLFPCKFRATLRRIPREVLGDTPREIAPFLFRIAKLLVAIVCTTTYCIADDIGQYPNTNRASLILPFREFAGKSGGIVTLLGSAHVGIGDLSVVNRQNAKIIRDAEVVLLENYRSQDESSKGTRRLHQIFDDVTLSRMEALVKRTQMPPALWSYIRDSEMSSAVMLTVMMGACIYQPGQLKAPTQAVGMGIDDQIVSIINSGIQIKPLETSQDRRALQTQEHWEATASGVYFILNALTTPDACIKLRGISINLPNLFVARRIDEAFAQWESVDQTITGGINRSAGHYMSDERNDLMMRAILSESEKFNNVLVVVGALHIASKAGLVERLLKHGYREKGNNLLP